MPVPTKAKFDKLTFAGNPLNKYDSVDYRLRLSIVRPQDAVFHDPSKGYVLAESATTSRFILTDMELKQTYGLSSTARTSFFASGVITIMDPSGLRFMDAIVGAASSLGVKNGILNCRYIIEAEFVGTLPDGTVQTDPERGMYVVQVFKTEVRLTEKGGEFKLFFGGLDYDAARHVNVTFQKIKEIKHNGHISGFMKELETKLKEEEAQKVARGEQQYPNEWHFILEPFIEGSPHFQFTSENPEMQNYRDRTQKPMDGSDGQLNASREGSTVIQVIDNAFADTKAMKYGLNQDNTLSDPLTITTKDKALEDAKKIKQMYRIDVMVEPDTKWDSITNDYVKKFYYYIFLQDEPDWFYGPVNQISKEEWQTIVAARLANGAYINNLRKRYDYYYTGLNTEIVKFDLQMNHGIFIAEHLLRQYSSGSGTAPGQRGSQFPSVGRNGPTGGANNATPPTNSVGQRLTYAEQFITTQTTSNKAAGQQASGGGTGGDQVVFPHIYSYDNRNTDKGSSPSLPSEDDRRRMKFQHVFDRLEYTGPDFMRIIMSVRGDPYWFGTTKPVYTKGGSQAPASLAQYNQNRADFFYGKQRFYIEIDTADYAEQTQEGLINTTRAITGVYTITQCTNRFVGGRFEQELVGTRDLMIDGPSMWQAIQNSVTQ